jgi:hypothetical protein
MERWTNNDQEAAGSILAYGALIMFFNAFF